MTTPSWAGPIRTVDGRDEVLVPCDTCGGPVYESCRTRWRERGRRDCGVFCDFLGVAEGEDREAVEPVTESPRADVQSGWCGRGAHHRCVGAYDVVCGCACHESSPIEAVLGGARIGTVTLVRRADGRLVVTGAGGTSVTTWAAVREHLTDRQRAAVEELVLGPPGLPAVFSIEDRNFTPGEPAAEVDR